MDKDGHDFTLAKGRVKTLLKEHSSGRVADDAVLRVIFEEEEAIAQIAQKAQEFAHHAGRKTVMEEDVRMAYKYEKQ